MSKIPADADTAEMAARPRPASEESSSLRPGSLLGGRFRLDEVLGGGGSGTVYAAFDSAIDEKVAIKILHPKVHDERSRERLRREVRSSRPGHPHAVTVYDLHESDERLYLSMELVQGVSLARDLADHGPLTVDRCIAIGMQVASALEHIHTRGIVHRDVKPGNIMITESGDAKLCDMGLARPLEAGVTVTESEMVVGTPAYMAPEQATGEELTPASDVYALGLTLYKALTGEVPLTRPTAVATLSRRLKERPAPVRRHRSDCPRWLDRLLRRMLAPRPGERPSARQVGQALSSRRLRPRPTGRQLGLGSGLLVLGLGAWQLSQLALSTPAVRFETTGTQVRGVDQQGRVRWTRKFEIPVANATPADLDGDGTPELLIELMGADESASRKINENGPEIVILKLDGDILSSFSPEENVNWSFPYDVELQSTLRVVDVDHDGTNEVALICVHRNFYPAVLFLYWPTADRWEQLLSHTGYLSDVAATPEQLPAGVRFLAINNQLALYPVIGEFLVSAPGARPTSLVNRQPLSSPPGHPLVQNDRAEWSFYVPIGKQQAARTAYGARLVNTADGGLELRNLNSTLASLDRFANPTPGANAGEDLLALRREFMSTVTSLEPMNQPFDVQQLSRQARQAGEKYSKLLTEEPYRVLLDLAFARALARAGDQEAALNLLRQTVRTSSNTDLLYRLAHLEAARGDLRASVERLNSLHSADVKDSRQSYDGPQLLLRVGIELKDPELVEGAIAWLGKFGSKPALGGVLAGLSARARLWWDRVEPQDLSLTSYGYAPAAEAIACLARWRQGAATSEDVGRMEEFIERNPDARIEGRLARGAALMDGNDAQRALEEVSIICDELRAQAREDFAATQLHDLARALRVRAIAASGDHTAAREEARELQPELRPGLLPRILVDELLAD